MVQRDYSTFLNEPRNRWRKIWGENSTVAQAEVLWDQVSTAVPSGPTPKHLQNITHLYGQAEYGH